jgi:HK97 family phage prohead protease
VLVLLNHDNTRVLASTEEGNAVLEEDNIGLRAEITITDKEVVQKAREGKLSGWSFGFIANDDEMSTEGNDEIRTVTDMELLEVSILDDTKAPAYYGTSIESREGGARMVEIRAENFTQEQTENGTGTQSIGIDELAELVANKVIAALKAEEKAEEETDETSTTETEETTEGDVKEQTDTKTEVETEETVEETTEAEEKPENETEENRSIDYSAFEDRLNKLKK